jgi:DNA polymerase-1
MEYTFADCEGDNFLNDLTVMWTLQIAQGVDGEVVVYADQPGYPSIAEGLERLHTSEKIVFHNGMKFDYWAINKLYPGTLRLEQIVDSLIIARLMNPEGRRHSLADLGEALGFPKGHFKDFSKFSEEMVTYGRQDVRILQEAWKGARKVTPFGAYYEKFKRACDLEFEVAYVISKQERHGVRFNMDKALRLEGELRQEHKDLERELQVAFPTRTFERVSEKTGKRLKDGIDVFNPGSRDQIANRLIEKYGWKPHNKSKKTGKPKMDEEVIDSLPYPEAKLLSRYLAKGKMLGQLADGEKAWIKVAEKQPDGSYRIHGAVNTLGARTLRMSHFAPNLAQASKKDLRMRELFEPDAGHKMVGADADSLELRGLGHYLQPFDGGVMIRQVHSGDKSKGTDPHTSLQKLLGLHLRDSAKTARYAHLYGCFDNKLGNIILDDARDAGKPAPKGAVGALGKAARTKMEKGIVGFESLLTNVKLAHERQGWLPSLHGCHIKSASDHSALNTLIQGSGAVIMKVAQVLLDRAIRAQGWEDRVFWLLTIHDEFQLSAPPDLADTVAKMATDAIAEAGVFLKFRCPLIGNSDIGDNWRQTH